MKLGDKCVKDKCEDLNLRDIASIAERTGRKNAGKILGKGGRILLLVEFYCLGATLTLLMGPRYDHRFRGKDPDGRRF